MLVKGEAKARWQFLNEYPVKVVVFNSIVGSKQLWVLRHDIECLCGQTTWCTAVNGNKTYYLILSIRPEEQEPRIPTKSGKCQME